MSREEVQEAGSPFNLAPIGGRRNGSNSSAVDSASNSMPAAKLFSFFFLFITDCPPQGAQSRVCTRAKRIKGKSISFDALSRSTPPSSSSSSLLTSCPSTRGEWIQKFPSVGKVRDCVGSNEGIDGSMKIEILFRDRFFFWNHGGKSIPSICGWWWWIRARWRIFDVDGID